MSEVLKEKITMSDPISFFLFFFVVVPLILINLNNMRKRDIEMHNLQKETNRLLTEIAGNLKNNT
jgi:hypothetical protein